MAQADGVEHGPVVVDLHQQQGLVTAAVGGLCDRTVQFGGEVGAVVQAGDLVALAQRIEFFQGLLVDMTTLVEQDLQARFSLERGLGKFHRRLEGFAVGALRLELQVLGRGLSLAQLLQQVLEASGVRAGDHVEQRQAFDFFPALVTEHLEVGGVGPDMHALVHIGDRVARGRDEGIAATFGVTQRRLQATQRAALVERGEFVPHHMLQVVGLGAQRHAARTGGHGGEFDLFRDAVDRGHHRNVLAAGLDRGQHLGERDRLGRVVGQHQIDGLFLEHRGQIIERFWPVGANRDAAVAQDADQLFCVIEAVLHEQQPDDGIVVGHEFGRFLLARDGYMLGRDVPATWANK